MDYESFNLKDQLSFMVNYLPQPFYIEEDNFKEMIIIPDHEKEDKYSGCLVCNDGNEFLISKKIVGQIVNSLGIKSKLVQKKVDTINVWDNLLPIVNTLLKEYIRCFVFYKDDAHETEITAMNVNSIKGASGSKFEKGPSPYEFVLPLESERFLCFNNFLSKFEIDNDTLNIKVLAKDILVTKNMVQLDTYKELTEGFTQPLIRISSLYNDLNGFKSVKTMLVDKETGIYIMMPKNYSDKDCHCDYNKTWEKLIHISEHVDYNDIFNMEINNIASDNNVPTSVQKMAISILTSSVPISPTSNLKEMIKQAFEYIQEMKKPSEIKSFKLNFGSLLGWCICKRMSACKQCHHLDEDLL